MVAIGVKSKTCKHVLHIVKSQLALLAVELVRSYNRSSREALAALAYVCFLECGVRLLHLLLWRNAHVESLCESLLYCF